MSAKWTSYEKWSQDFFPGDQAYVNGEWRKVSFVGIDRRVGQNTVVLRFVFGADLNVNEYTKLRYRRPR